MNNLFTFASKYRLKQNLAMSDSLLNKEEFEQQDNSNSLEESKRLLIERAEEARVRISMGNYSDMDDLIRELDRELQ